MKKILNKKEIKELLEILEDLYPDARCELDYGSPFELLIATILSAQCTDVRVNMVTKELFKIAKGPREIVELGYDGLVAYIKTCGLYQAKAKNILETSKILLEKYDGQVPDKMENLVGLPGVGRKTANVVLSNAFNIPAIAVDTHVFRLSNRIGLVDAKDVVATELELMKKIRKDLWTLTHHRLIIHGRRVCKARSPLCKDCKLRDLCIYGRKLNE